MMLLYNRRGATTAKALHKILGMKKVRDDKWKASDGVPIIRWGSSKYVPNDTCELNSATSIGLTAHGVKSLDALMEAGIPVPNTYLIYNEEDVPDKHLLARKINHVGGTDIIDCPTHEQAITAFRNGRRFFSEYVETARELRVHVIDGEAVKGFRKVNDNEDAGFVRSAKKGWSYRRVDLEKYYPLAVPIAVDVLKTLGLTFGAVDMACDESKTQWVVWEANSAPSLNSDTIKLYVEFFRNKLNI